MLKNIIIGLLLCLGVWCICSDKIVGSYAPARRALKARKSQKSTGLTTIKNKLVTRIEPRLHIEQVNRARLQDALINLGKTETPEHYKAGVWADTILYSLVSLPVYFFSVVIGAAMTIIIALLIYKRENNKIFGELTAKRKAIEKELPQFAATIRQALNYTRDIRTILENYSEIAGETLQGEIRKTLNDIYMSGNPENAIQSLEKRVSSAELSKLTRSLTAICRGDDQRSFLDGLTAEYRKTQDAAVDKELLLRPAKLNPYLAALFVSLVMLIAASMGQFVAQSITQIFN